MIPVDHNQQNLYEIPNCTICLNELNQDLTNLNCGHVFHLNCISQHFQYRGTCPNCQKRSHSKEIRMVVYPLTKNNQSAVLMRQVLGNLSSDQKQQVQALFKQVRTATQKNEKLQSRITQAQKQLKKSTNQLNDTKVAYNKSKHELQSLKKDSLQLKKVIQHLHNEIKNLNTENFNLRVEVQNYKQKQSEYDKMKILKRKMAENSSSLIAYKNELENKSTSPQQMARIFFDMIMIKNLEVLKLKNSMQIHPQKLMEKEEQVTKLRCMLQREKKEIKDIQQKRAVEKKKYDDLKTKYKNLIEKYKAKCQQVLSEQDNYQDSMLSRPSFPLANSTNGNSKLNSSMQNIIKEQNISSVENKGLKRNSSSMFDSIMEEEQIKEGTKNNQNIKKPIQQSLNTFVTQKNNFTPAFGSFGGIGTKKKVEDKKAFMKNIFG